MIRFDSPWRGLTWLATVGLLLAPACATPEAAERPDAESGGSASSEGGASSSGGSSSGAPSFGGTTSSGGATSNGGSSDGGSSSSGGSSSGGASSTGGATAKGGASATGGTSSGGSAQGGAKSTGGASATGGTSSGGSAQGGSKSTGGASPGGSGGALQGTGGSAGAATGGSGGGTSCSGAIFCDDFEDGNSTGWTPSGGTWTVTSDGSGVYSGGLGSYFSTAGSVQGNQTVQARMKVLTMSSGSSYRAGIVARYGSSSNAYLFALDGAGDFRLLKGSSSPSGASGGCDTVASGLGSNVVNTWMTLKMVVSGSGSSVHITTFRDGAAVHDCTTTSSTVASGVGGVMSYGSNTRAEFDDFRLTSP